MAFELDPFGIGIKTVSPGSTRTDFASRSLELATHPAYGNLLEKVITFFTGPAAMENLSEPEQIANVVYEAATDGKDRLRYVAGADAQALYAQRLKVGDEVLEKELRRRFLAANKNTIWAKSHGGSRPGNLRKDKRSVRSAGSSYSMILFM